MVDELQSICSGNAHSPSRPRNLHLHGCQSFRFGSSSRTDESILSRSLFGRPIPTPYQHVGNNGHSFRTDKSLEIYSPFLCHDIHRQHSSGLIYQQARRRGGGGGGRILLTYAYRYGKFSYGAGNIILSLGIVISQANSMSWQTGYREQTSSQNRVGFGSIESEFNFPNVQLSQSGSVCNSLQSQTATLCIPNSGQSSFRNRRIFHELELSSCLRFSPNNTDSFCAEQDTPTSVQNSSDSPSLATTNLVLRGPTTTCLSSSSSSSCSKPIKSRKAPASKSPSSQPSRMGVIKQSIRDKKKFRKILRILSPDQDEHQLRKYMTPNGSFVTVGVIEGRLIRSRPLLL